VELWKAIGGPGWAWRDGDGVFRMLPFWLCFRLLTLIQNKMTAARIRAAPKREPTTTPAMAPPERPEPDLAEPAVAPVEVALGAGAVLDGCQGAMDVVVGRWTPTQRDSTFALMQHESVELGELAPQKAQRPGRFDW
jgi:hypothetical protein